ncbi:zinc-finger of the MIZ type in Nse subunit-domain-containing protein [Lineolata rhizophorae]|uniref:Zinc-finger of the MIZ type in Nse subunit-domain-containing protein n=1 Tax=Lineolata rhizophorae TaxID=578093 RepID=A0A6A6NQR7_9PEZI|nr:zinc-finger of the MIZ type in Nse subunit-domain-containing protein [Lineolata rhizophorae]
MDVDSSGATANDTQPTIPGMTPNNMAPEAISVAQFFKDCLGAEEADYQRLSRHARFASHNDYVNFRRVIWDSQHHIGPDGEMAAMPPRSTWFRDRGSPAPGVTGSQQDGAEGHDEDDDMDIEVARERISTKCPLTLQELVDPVTSRKCPHTFERSAIMNMINSSGMRAGGSHARGARDGERVVQCPVPGCSKMLLKSDLFADPLLQRRIRRIQEARRQSDEFEDEDEDDMKDDDSDTAANAAMVTSSQASLPESQIKAERRSQHSPPQRRQQVLQSSQADGVDLGGEDTEDE